MGITVPLITDLRNRKLSKTDGDGFDINNPIRGVCTFLNTIYHKMSDDSFIQFGTLCSLIFNLKKGFNTNLPLEFTYRQNHFTEPINDLINKFYSDIIDAKTLEIILHQSQSNSKLVAPRMTVIESIMFAFSTPSRAHVKNHIREGCVKINNKIISVSDCQNFLCSCDIITYNKKDCFII